MPYDSATDPLKLGLVCKLCVLDRLSAKLPANLNEQPRYPTDDALREHWNAVHEPNIDSWRWKGTEAIWRSGSAVSEARGLSAGFIIAFGDGEGTHYVLWCLHCDHQTSDPLAVEQQRCPKCNREYAHLGVW